MAAAAPKEPAGGTVRVFVTPGTNGGGSVVITGAIGDYGTVAGDTSNGRNPTDYVKLTLKGGTIEVNQTAFEAKLNKATFPILQSSCSSEESATGPASVFGGTGLHKGISGTVKLTETQAWILSRESNGKCKRTESVYLLLLNYGDRVSPLVSTAATTNPRAIAQAGSAPNRRNWATLRTISRVRPPVCTRRSSW
jgi:hypothetical protein